MKKIFIILCYMMLATNILYAQTVKVTGLTADTSPTSDDLIMTVDDVAGTPTSKKVTIANLLVDSLIPNDITITESDPTLTNDAAVTVGAGSGDVTITFNSDGGTDGTITWDSTNDEFDVNGNINVAGSGDSFVIFGTMETAPATSSNEMAIYTKVVSGQPEFFVREEASGTEVQITSAGAVNASGTGDITDVYNCSTGDCATITMGATDTLVASDGSLINFSASNASSTTDGIILPQNTNCASATAEGQLCWDSDNDVLYAGDGTGVVNVNGSGSGDITDVFDCSTGNCSSITATDGDLLDFSAITISSTTEGLILGGNTDCSSATAEGQVCWDTDDNALYIGGGVSAAQIGAGSGGGNFFWVLEPQEAKLPTSNPMAIDASGSKWKGLLDASTIESATWETVLYPFPSGTLKAKVYYTMASATSGTVEFDLDVDCFTDADAFDLDTTSYGTANVLTATVPATAGYLDVLADAALNGDSCAQYDHMTVRILRDATDGTNDTATGDAELRKVVIYAE